MYYYEDGNFGEEPTLMSWDEFTALFGVEYTVHWLEGYHCCIDPYYDEIYSLKVPLIADTLEELRSEYRDSCQEI